MDRNQKKALKAIVAQNGCIEVIETIGTEKVIEALLSKYAVCEILEMIADGMVETHRFDEMRQDVIEQIIAIAHNISI